MAEDPRPAGPRLRLLTARRGDGELFYAEQARWRARFGVLLEERPSWDQPLHRLVTEAQEAIRQAQARYPWQGGHR